VVAAGGRQRSVPPAKYPYPGSHATGANCPGYRNNADAQPDEEGQGVVTGIQDVVVPELTSGILYTMLARAAVVDIVSQYHFEEKNSVIHQLLVLSLIPKLLTLAPKASSP
jgi:hypothetical protein